MDQVADKIREIIAFGIDLLREGAGLDVTAVTFIVQICATIVLFLFVRFKFWNQVTGILNKRKQLVQTSLDQKAEAENSRQLIREETKLIQAQSKAQAERIVAAAVAGGEKQSEEIKARAEKEIEDERKKNAFALEKERAELYRGIKNEIVEVAYQIAEQIIEHEIDEKSHQNLVNRVLEKEGYINAKRS